MADIFEKYGGQSLPEQPVQEPAKDPFAAYGGQEIDTSVPSPESKPDPFAAYGGESEYSKLKKETSNYGWFDLVKDQAAEARGGRLWTKATPNKDIQTIAEEHKVNYQDLRDLAPYHMALPPAEEIKPEDYAKFIAGTIGYGMLGDVPQWAFKKLQDPNMRAALDDLRDLAEGRVGGVLFTLANLIPTPKIGLAAKAVTGAEKAGMALAKGAVGGAIYGVAGSSEGSELEGALMGAAVGGGIAGAVRGGDKLLAKIRGGDVAVDAVKGPKGERVVDRQSQEAMLQYAKNNETQITEVAEKAWAGVEKSETELADAIVRKKELTDDAVDTILSEQTTPDSIAVVKKQLAEAAGKEVTEVTDREVAEKLVGERKEAFADQLAKETPAYGKQVIEGQGEKQITREPTADEILARAAGAGEERLIDKFLGESYVRTGIEQIDKLKVRSAPDAAPLGKLIINGLSDRQFVLKTIDEVKGSNLLPHFYDLMSNYNHFTAEKSLNEKQIGVIFKQARKGKLVKDLSDDAGGDLFRLLDENKEGELTGSSREVASAVRSMLDRIVDRANTMEGTGIKPLNIAKRADFGMPNILKKPVDAVLSFKQKAAEASSVLEQRMGKRLDEIVTTEDFSKAMETSSAFRELVGGVKLFYQQPIRDGEIFQDALREVTQRGASNPRLHSVASTTLRREDKIPDFLREKNVFQILKRYSENTMRDVYLREPLGKLANEARLLKASKANVEAAYVERLVADNMGIRAMSMARLGNEARIKFAEVVDRQLTRFIPDPVKRKATLDGFRLIPELMANLQYNIYPNVLGMNPRAHVSQLVQTWCKNAPEIGGLYGYELTLKSFSTAVFALRSGNARRMIYGKVEQYGLEPKSFVREASESLATEAERHVLYNTGANTIRRASDAFMYSYGKMDTFNRAVTANMAERLILDLNAGSKDALAAVSKMPISIRRDLVKNKGNVEKQMAITAKYLNGVTQYNYNRAAMSELGIIAGPFFSTFTKWPLATAGDIASDLRTRGLTGGGLRSVEKYGVTILLASILDNAIRYSLGGELDVGGDYADYDERVRKILGTGGLVSMAPVMSAAGLLPGGRDKSLFTPPVVDSFYNGILNPMMNGDTDKLLKEGKKAVLTYTPGAFVYRFVAEDMPLYITGEKPE